ncbi:MAG: mandelate racemase/muconate lactonizing enzyme family protein [Desulfobacteraceae bacterium]|nr:MAG: mandelate racemase/muconate lactonizing enzyme family protein [Desulfobacteraceae bacterium]
MRIVELKAYPISVPVPEDRQVSLGIGRMIKRDAVVVRVKTESGLIGYGESHHGRCPGAVAHIVNTTLHDLVKGMDAADVVGIWARIYKMQLGSHGMGAACCLAMSGIDTALWDIRGKAVGWPIYRLLGGSRRAIPAYAGGVSLGFQTPESLAEEAGEKVASGFRAVKLRVGDSPERDIERVSAVREAFPALSILTDANTGYTLDDARLLLPVFDSLRIGWLEEPFPAHDFRAYAAASVYGTTPLALGENTYTRFEFNRIIEDGHVRILQPDIAKTGGITEGVRIAAAASAWKIPVHPHTSITGLSMAASLHFLAAIENGGYYEADVSAFNPLRDRLVDASFAIDSEGCIRPPEGPGLGVEVDEEFLMKHPVIEGASYV